MYFPYDQFLFIPQKSSCLVFVCSGAYASAATCSEKEALCLEDEFNCKFMAFKPAWESVLTDGLSASLISTLLLFTHQAFQYFLSFFTPWPFQQKVLPLISQSASVPLDRNLCPAINPHVHLKGSHLILLLAWRGNMLTCCLLPSQGWLCNFLQGPLHIPLLAPSQKHWNRSCLFHLKFTLFLHRPFFLFSSL